jgi:fumarate reductase (CoM/CoB) subunit B
MVEKDRKWAMEIGQRCVECGNCAESCRLLTDLKKCPKTLALRGISWQEAYGCALCGKCEAVCNLGLSPFRMFEQRRVEAVKNKEIDVNEYRYLFPDRPVTVMSLFREFYGIDYAGLNMSVPSETAFLPGCTMFTYSPELTKKVYAALAKDYRNPILLDDCCGLPMYQIGLPARGDKIKERLKTKVTDLGVKRLIVACPNCYYQLKKENLFRGVELVTVYEALHNYFVPNRASNGSSEIYTVHDSCPDRFEGIFAQQVRAALEQAGYPLAEMKHNRQNSICCGSSGQLEHFRPEWSKEHHLQNLDEAAAAGADVLLAYCQACVLNIGDVADRRVKVKHVLNLLLEFEEDYKEIKQMASEMFLGEQGFDLYIKLLEEPV